jgi:hypothetical protein
MNDLSVAFKVVSERNCPFYASEDLFVLTGQSVQLPLGHPSCLILVREMTNLLFNTVVPAAETDFQELKDETYSCGGCTGLIKFQFEDDPQIIEQGASALPEDSVEVERREGEPGKSRVRMEGVVVSGQISEVSTSELMQFFHMHQKTGKLVLDVANGTGRIAFRDGGIIGAKYMAYEDKEAIFALLREKQGRFSFVNGIPPSLQEVNDIGDFMMILMDGIKQMDEEGS